MKRIPDNVVFYKRSPQFDQDTTPANILKAHTTKPGVWGRIVVTEGSLTYHIVEPEEEAHELRPGVAGVVEPTMKHYLRIDRPVRFHVEFLKEETAEKS